MDLRINDINIKGFQCYSDSETIPLAKETTIFYGDNGSGKTTILKALKYALSVFFSSSTNWGVKNLNKEVTGLKTASVSPFEFYKDSNNEPDDFTEITINALFENTQENWIYKKSSSSGSRVQASLFKTAFTDFINIYNNTLPVLAFYSEAFPHVKTNIGKKVQNLFKKQNSWFRCWGYYHWDNYSSSCDIWEKRFIQSTNRYYKSMNKVIKGAPAALTQQLTEEADKYKIEINYVKKYLSKFTNNNIDTIKNRDQDFKILDFDSEWISTKGNNIDSISLLFGDGVKRDWDNLPAGYNRILSIVFDIAYRSYILNEGRCEPFGIVIIDEIDLHLHPHLQEDILQRLKYTFPNIQFIVSTHSPLVLSNFKQNDSNYIIKLQRLENNYRCTRTNDISGFSPELIYSEAMDVNFNQLTIADLKDRYNRFISRGNTEYAEKVLNTIQSMVSDDYYQVIKNDLTKSR